MKIFWSFAPFIVFAVLLRIGSAEAGLIGGAVTSFFLIARDWKRGPGAIPLLELGSTMLFAALAIFTVCRHPNWSIPAVRLVVDSGLLTIILLSIAAGRPFTLTYARQEVEEKYWNEPKFITTNYVISAAWAGAFVILIAADLLMVYAKSTPTWVGVASTVGALYAAIIFTSWYPDRQAENN